MRRIPLWLFILVVFFLVFLAILAAGQVVTFAWLSAFQSREADIPVLRLKSWIWGALSVLLMGLAVAISIVRLRQRGSV